MPFVPYTFVEPNVVFSGIEELADPDKSPMEHYGRGGFAAVRVWKVPYAQRHTFARQLLGGPTLNQYILPFRYPDFPAARAVEVDIEPFGAPKAEVGADGRLEWEFAKVTCKFETDDMENEQSKDGQPLTSESMEGAAEFITIPASGLYWDENLTEQLQDTEAPGKILKLTTLTVTYHGLITVPPEVWSLVGCVNADRVKSAFYGRIFEPGTLLFNPPTTRRELAANGTRTQELTLHFHHKEDGWNKFKRRGSDDPQPIYRLQPASGGSPERAVPYEVYPSKPFYPFLPKA